MKRTLGRRYLGTGHLGNLPPSPDTASVTTDGPTLSDTQVTTSRAEVNDNRPLTVVNISVNRTIEHTTVEPLDAGPLAEAITELRNEIEQALRDAQFDINPLLRRDDEFINAFYDAITEALMETRLQINAESRDRFIHNARNDRLERLAKPVNITRESGERDLAMQTRTKAAYGRAASNATIHDLAQVLMVILEAEPNEVTIRPSEDNEPVVFADIDARRIVDVPFDTEFIGDLVHNAVPAGHNIEVFAYGDFEFEDADYDPPEGTGFEEGTFTGPIDT